MGDLVDKGKNESGREREKELSASWDWQWHGDATEGTWALQGAAEVFVVLPDQKQK